MKSDQEIVRERYPDARLSIFGKKRVRYVVFYETWGEWSEKEISDIVDSESAAWHSAASRIPQ